MPAKTGNGTPRRFVYQIFSKFIGVDDVIGGGLRAVVGHQGGDGPGPNPDGDDGAFL